MEANPRTDGFEKSRVLILLANVGPTNLAKSKRIPFERRGLPVCDDETCPGVARAGMCV